jgi:glycosyl transferase family 25
MRVFVINLAESEERRESIAVQMARLGVSFGLFEAVDARRGPSFFAAYDERKYLANTGRTASPGEIACYASHLCLWQRCVAGGEPIVVLEDDARILPSFSAALAEVEKLIWPYGFIRLQEHGPSRHLRTTLVDRAGNFTLHRFTSYPFGAMAYAISPRVADVFIDKSRVLGGPVDLFIKKFWEHGQPLFGLSPSPVENSELCGQSTITQREKRRATARMRVLRFCNKLSGVIGRARFNLRFGGVSP